LLHGDCLEEMKKIKDNSIDMVLCDPPYNITQCKWDLAIPFEPMWEQLNRITKQNSAIVIFGSEPFSSFLRVSNMNMYKYDWIWVKDKATNHLNAKKQPMRKTEVISVFYKKQCIYNPQLTKKEKKNIRPATTIRKNIDNYGKMDKKSLRDIPIDMTYPNNMLFYRACFGDKGKSLHPTQKPVELMEYLIKTYTNESDIVLDFAMGSGTTGIACQNLNRNFIGIELDKNYFEIASKRMEENK